MKIVKERTRLIFSNYNDNDKSMIEELVSTMDKVFTFEDPDKHIICLPTGMEESIKQTFKLPIEDRSNQYWPAQKVTFTPEKYFGPRNDMQKDAIEFGLKQIAANKKLGLILGPGSGKTFIACYLAVKTGLKTLIITPTTNVRGQWAETLMNMFNIPAEKIKVIQNPADLINTDADYIVALQASMANINKRYDLEKILKDKSIGIKIIDETHMYFHNIIRIDGCSNIQHNWYVTATFGRSSEDEDKIYHEMFGDIGLFRVKDKKSTIFNRKPGDIYGQKPHMNVDMFWLKSGLKSEDVKKVNTSKRYNEKDNTWVRYGISIPAYTELVIPKDGTMTLFLKKCLEIIKQTERKVKYGRTLILTPTIASVEILAEHVRKLFPNDDVGTIHSKNNATENARVMKESHFIISTIKSSGTGFDVKDLAKLVCIEQYKSQILAEQVSGRLRRRPDGKETYMADIVDANVRQLRAWGASRAQILKRKSKKFTVIDV